MSITFPFYLNSSIFCGFFSLAAFSFLLLGACFCIWVGFCFFEGGGLCYCMKHGRDLTLTRFMKDSEKLAGFNLKSSSLRSQGFRVKSRLIYEFECFITSKEGSTLGNACVWMVMHSFSKVIGPLWKWNYVDSLNKARLFPTCFFLFLYMILKVY